MFSFSNLFSRNDRKGMVGRAFSEIGRKENQEDFVFPELTGKEVNSDYFILCDGMGGHDSGEIASKAAATALGESFAGLEFTPDEGEDRMKEEFIKGLDKAYDRLDSVDTFSQHKMGTTMTAVLFNGEKYLAGHIGDSRIYHIRPSFFKLDDPTAAILFRTEDDSLVNQLLRAGEITEEEARNYPHKNIITKAMQPHQERRSKASLHYSEDLQKGDYFFLCCDGILEQLQEETLCRILAGKESDKNKLEAIRQVCLGKTKDNFTCWLIRNI